MKLKYKKMIIMISMCTMGIGMVTFSMAGKSKNSTTDVVGTSKEATTFQAKVAETTDLNESLVAAVPSVTVAPTATPTAEPTVAPNPLEKDTNKAVNTLVKKYFKAKLSVKKANFKGLVNSVKLVNTEAIKREVKYIQKYINIHTYTKNGPIEGSYAVYVYYESKFKNIKTPAPGMVEFYVKTNQEGKLYIYMGQIDKDTEQYLYEARNAEDTMEVIYQVNEKYKDTVKQDSALAQFNTKLEETAKNITKNITKSATKNISKD